MILGMSPMVFIHVVISLVAIVAGVVAVAAMFKADRAPKWTAAFLGLTVLTNLSGFILPADKFLPSHATGIVCMATLIVALYALYVKKLSGRWRALYVGTAVASLYLNVFVLVVQIFLKVPAVKALAPTQQEPPFAIAQGIVFVAFVVIAVLAVKRFHPR
jgi:hypothetical protein